MLHLSVVGSCKALLDKTFNLHSVLVTSYLQTSSLQITSQGQTTYNNDTDCYVSC